MVVEGWAIRYNSGLKDFHVTLQQLNSLCSSVVYLCYRADINVHGKDKLDCGMNWFGGSTNNPLAFIESQQAALLLGVSHAKQNLVYLSTMQTVCALFGKGWESSGNMFGFEVELTSRPASHKTFISTFVLLRVVLFTSAQFIWVLDAVRGR